MLWREQLAKAYADVTTVRGLLDTAAVERVEPDRLEALRRQTDAAGGELGQLGATAPDDATRARTAETEQALGSYMLAIEAEQLLLSDAAASEDARADANVARRARATELDSALTSLDTLIHPPVESPPPSA
jgi:hypothetical protein